MSLLNAIQRILKEGFLVKKVLLCLSGVFLFILISVNAQAYIYVLQQLPHSTPGGLVSSVLDYEGESGAQVWDDFTVPFASSITGVSWWGIYYPLSTNQLNFTFTFYNDDGGKQGSVYESYGPYSVTGQSGLGVYSYNFDGSFPAGTYWLSIYNNTSESSFAWQRAAVYGNGSIQSPEEFSGSPSNVAFQLTFSTPDTPVPIPAAAWLLASGLIGLVVIRRRVRIRKAR